MVKMKIYQVYEIAVTMKPYQFTDFLALLWKQYSIIKLATFGNCFAVLASPAYT